MGKQDLVKDVRCATAEELLDALTPHRGGVLWDRLDHTSWMFRGQSEATWGLRPKALRSGNPWYRAGLIPGQLVEPPIESHEERRRIEADFVLSFAARLSKLGHEIPFDSPAIRDDLVAPADTAANFPPPHLRGVFALAQHYGMPTRLLDWSLRPLIAAYFAAVGGAERAAQSGAGDVAVYALNMRFLRLLGTRNPGVDLVTVPTTTNPNLHAQAGVFTLVKFKTDQRRRSPPDLDDLLTRPQFKRLRDGSSEMLPLPMLVKLTMPVRDAPALLHYLSLAGVDASSVFAGHQAVYEGFKEERLRSKVFRALRVRDNRAKPPGA